jgi:hypothetical protein
VPGLTLTEARDINDDGVIVGWGTVRTSGGAVTRGFLLNPKLVDPNELAAATDGDTSSDDNDNSSTGGSTNDGTYSSDPDFGPPDFSSDATTADQDANSPTAAPGTPALMCGPSAATVIPLTMVGLFLLRLGYRTRH